MLPLIAAAAAGTSILANLVQGIRPPSSSSKISGPSFDSQLQKAQQPSIPNSVPDLPSIQNLLATYHAHGTLSPEQKTALGRMLVNKNVQMVDSGGNSTTGIVAGYGFSNGELSLVVNGRNQPLSSIQAVLNGVQTHS